MVFEILVNEIGWEEEKFIRELKKVIIVDVCGDMSMFFIWNIISNKKMSY